LKTMKSTAEIELLAGPTEPKSWLEDGLALRVARRKAGITQAALAERAGMSRSLVRDVELGRVRFTGERSAKLWEALSSFRFAESEVIALRSCLRDGTITADYCRRELLQIIRRQALAESEGRTDARPGPGLDKVYTATWAECARLERLEQWEANRVLPAALQRYDWSSGSEQPNRLAAAMQRDKELQEVQALRVEVAYMRDRIGELTLLIDGLQDKARQLTAEQGSAILRENGCDTGVCGK
jgi:transcriptional regulator with XRE-family HTH domain